MTDTVLSVSSLGKSYRIGSSPGRAARTFREAIVGFATGPLARIRNGGASGLSEEFWALRNIDFKVSDGEVVGVIGRNGAGKSTLLKILSGITPPSRGRVEINGRVGSLLEVGYRFSSRTHWPRKRVSERSNPGDASPRNRKEVRCHRRLLRRRKISRHSRKTIL